MSDFALRDSLQFHRCTDAVHHVFDALPRRAHQAGIQSVEPTTIFPLVVWTLINGERKVALNVLLELGVDPPKLNASLYPLFGALAQRCSLPNDAAAKEAIELVLSASKAESDDMKFDYIGTEHLLLSAVKLMPHEFSEVLQYHGITFDAAKTKICEILGCP